MFFFHGAPMSRLHLVGMEEQFAAQGLRVVSPDRPGYGRSSPQPGRSLGDWPADVAALADALGVDRFLVAGHSSGGPYAVVCAALLGERVRGGVVLAGVTDMAWPGAWDGYLEGRKEIQIMRLPDERAAIATCAEHFGADGSGFLAEQFDLPQPDTALLADEAVEQALTATLAEAFRQGVTGYAQDVYLEGRGWHFDPSRISAPIAVLHGELDTLVPMAQSPHGRGDLELDLPCSPRPRPPHDPVRAADGGFRAPAVGALMYCPGRTVGRLASVGRAVVSSRTVAATNNRTSASRSRRSRSQRSTALNGSY